MNLKAGLWQQQTLKLTMTQELSQAIALLQYSTHELTEFLENKSLENPLITIGAAPGQQRKKKGKAEKSKSDWIEQIADKSFSLEELLLSQLNFKKYSKLQLSTIKTLLEYLDESGYFRGDTEEIAKKRTISKELVEECLKIIQGLEPVGVGARNLQECLLIQIEWEYPDDELAQKIIADHFVLFAEKKWKPLAKELQVSVKEIQDVFDRVQELNPKPCAEFSTDQTYYIVPDAIIEVTSEGVSVRLWEAAIPKINFNESYYKQFSTSGDHQVGKFLQEKMQDFQWIMKSIEQRKETLARVIMKITEKQSEFFLKGPKYLNPMTMKELAQELDVHESTISRAVREKFVQTPSGTIPLKSFFSSTIQTVSDENTSSSQVKNALSLLIEKENKENPFSDQEIVELLKAKEGIVVSRRTVAKYRDQLGIPSSTKRKRY
ncbi:RNA polymerase factor sigma-54 [Bacillus sp. EB600]|uniref:RNA polymerase factor sigma-54 n=1 Tax=Bacillus sp. EB600 TaxID=2806345 RepID=UPI002109097D|nr:RNA polymerase factor sigma-54 [Bacillus sp. EB600]MCQ6278760.1 RNA polymerase factor sigma-54 [Bacillus sp. EB600]